jgi:hypothetical protein
MIVYKIASSILKRNHYFKGVQRFTETKYKAIKWKGVIVFYYDSYMVFSMIGWISMNDLRFGFEYTSTEPFSSVLGVTLFTFSFIYPVLSK